MRTLPTRDRIVELLDYLPETGVFVWKHRMDAWRGWNARWAGRKAGTIVNGYVSIGIDYHQCYAHRLAWLYVYGTLPPEFLDHANGIKHDNRISNLREATKPQNSMNSPGRSKLGLPKGVSWNGSSFVAQILAPGRKRHIGSYGTVEEASAAYSAEAMAHFGEFARTE
jgi:hypothetical protein